MASAGFTDRKASGCTGGTMNHTVTREELDVALLQVRAEHEAALLQIHAEIAEDRKRITIIEEFARELFRVLWMKFRGIRSELNETVRDNVPYFLSKSERSSMDEFSVEA